MNINKLIKPIEPKLVAMANNNQISIDTRILSYGDLKEVRELEDNYRELAEEMIDIGKWCGNWVGFEKTSKAIKETMERQTGKTWEELEG